MMQTSRIIVVLLVGSWMDRCHGFAPPVVHRHPNHHQDVRSTPTTGRSGGSTTRRFIATSFSEDSRKSPPSVDAADASQTTKVKRHFIERSFGFTPIHHAFFPQRVSTASTYAESYAETYPFVDDIDHHHNTVTAATATIPATQPTKKTVTVQKKIERTYYEILGVDPTATRVELKKQYITLARETHPDAASGRDRSAEFSDIAHAWKVLSNTKDRRRYDRSLVAQEFIQTVETAADNAITVAVPQLKKVLDNVCLPLFRKTADVMAQVKLSSTATAVVVSSTTLAFLPTLTNLVTQQQHHAHGWFN